MLMHCALVVVQLWEGFWIVKAICDFITGFWRFFHQGKEAEAPFWLRCLISANLIILLMGLCVVMLCGLMIVGLTFGSVCELALWQPVTGKDPQLIKEREELLPREDDEDETRRKRG